MSGQVSEQERMAPQIMTRKTCVTPGFQRIAVLVMAASLAACAAGDEGYFPERTGYLSPPPRTETAMTGLTYSMPLVRGQTSLDQQQIRGLNQFLALNGQGDGDHIEIRTRTGQAIGTPVSYNEMIAENLRQSFIRGGYAPSNIRIVNASDNANQIDVVIERYEAILPDCSHELLEPNNPWLNEPVGLRRLGCSNERNLGLMIADPRDLTGDRELAPEDGQRAVDAYGRYRRGEITPLEDSGGGGVEIELQ